MKQCALYTKPGSQVVNMIVIRAGDEPTFFGVDEGGDPPPHYERCHFEGSIPSLWGWLLLWWAYRARRKVQHPMMAWCTTFPALDPQDKEKLN